MGTATFGPRPARVTSSTEDRSDPAIAANTAAVITYSAAAGQRHVLSGLCFGYDAVPTGGTLKIEDGSGTVIFGPIPVTAAGAGPIYFDPWKTGGVNTAMIITLSAGGAGVKGYVSAINHWQEAG